MSKSKKKPTQLRKRFASGGPVDDLIDVYQGGNSSGFWTTDPERAASYGQVRRARVPRSVFEAGQKAAAQQGQPTRFDTFLPDLLGEVDDTIKPSVLSLSDTGASIDLNKAAEEAMQAMEKPKAKGFNPRGFFGVDALLEPMWGLIQNAPEGQEMLRSIGLGFLAPQQQQTYATGGQVKATGIRMPVDQVMQRMAAGGSIRPPQVTPVSGVATPSVPQGLPQGNQANVVGQTLQAIQNIKPELGGINAAAGKLEQFNPITGGAANTLQNIIQTGAPVDVSPLTQAARGQAQRTFGDLMGQTNEEFGALGLGSSSARQAQLGRQASNLAQAVGETGLISGVQAQEAARGRQLAGYNPLLAGSGQQLSGLQSAGGLRSDAASLGLQGQLGQAGAFNSLSGTLIPPTVSTNMMPMPGMQAKKVSAPGMGRTLGGPSYTARAATPLNLGKASNPTNRFASGGRVDMGDYLAALTFGQTFTRPEPPKPPKPIYERPIYQPVPRMPRPETPPAYLTSPQFTGRTNVPKFEPQPDYDLLRRYLLAGGSSTMVPVGLGDPRATEEWLRWMGPQRVHEGLMQTGRLMMTAASGGVIPGPAVPPDQVPILAQGGEGIIPVRLMSKLKKDKSNNPLIRELRDVMGFSGEDKTPRKAKASPRKMASGGKIAPRFSDFGGTAEEYYRQFGFYPPLREMEPGPTAPVPDVDLLSLLAKLRGSQIVYDPETNQLAPANARGYAKPGSGVGAPGLPEETSSPRPLPSERLPAPPDMSGSALFERKRQEQPPAQAEPSLQERLGYEGPERLQAETRFGTPREGGGGFSVMGAPPKSPEQQAYEAAKTKVALYSALAAKRQGGARALAPQLTAAIQEEAAAREILNAAEDRRRQELESILTAQTEVLKSQMQDERATLDRESAERRAQISADARRYAADQRGGGLDFFEPQQPASPIDSIMAAQSPEEAYQMLNQQDWNMLPRTPETFAQVKGMLNHLTSMGVSAEGVRASTLWPYLVSMGVT